MLQKNTKFFIFAFGSGVAVNLILNIIFVPYFGALAAAVTTLLAYLMVTLLIYFKSVQYIKFKVDFLFVAKSILASLIMAIAIYFANPVGMIRILLTIVAGAIIYFIILFLLKAFAKEEINIFSSAFKLDSFSKKY